METKKSLGQHWLRGDRIANVVDTADLQPGDHVLEVGPGPGNMTRVLLDRGVTVTAIELDEKLVSLLHTTLLARSSALARSSKENVKSHRDFTGPSLQRLTVLHADILEFDLGKLPSNYKVVANIPYYLTGKLVRKLVEADNPPLTITLLIQKEVAERLAAEPGGMSILSVSAQLFGKVSLGAIIPPEAFTPPPKVDSQVVHIIRHAEPPFPGLDEKSFFRLVRAGFGERRKKLRSSLSGGLHKSKEEIDQALGAASIDGDARAQELDLNDWYKLWQQLSS